MSCRSTQNGLEAEDAGLLEDEVAGARVALVDAQKVAARARLKQATDAQDIAALEGAIEHRFISCYSVLLDC